MKDKILAIMIQLFNFCLNHKMWKQCQIWCTDNIFWKLVMPNNLLWSNCVHFVSFWISQLQHIVNLHKMQSLKIIVKVTRHMYSDKIKAIFRIFEMIWKKKIERMLRKGSVFKFLSYRSGLGSIFVIHVLLVLAPCQWGSSLTLTRTNWW